MNVILTSELLQRLCLLGQESTTTTPAGSGPWNAVVMIFVILIGLFLLIILPNRSREKQAKKLLDSLKVNDKVLTTGGIIGEVYSIKRDEGEVVLRVDDNVKIRFAISAIYFVFNKEAAEQASKETKNKKS
ncbi:MAG: preprotein translocase subunit YajC [Planctomycetia bacterium]|nr:preprotein translocase subunit YajC [Planctomycetia bacterium]